MHNEEQCGIGAFPLEAIHNRHKAELKRIEQTALLGA